MLEGEGSFFSRLWEKEGKPRVNLTLTVNMADLDVIERAAGILGTPVNPLKPKPKRKPMFRTQANGGYAEKWMVLLYPHMGVRRKQQIRKALSRYRRRTNNSRTRVEVCRKIAAERSRDAKGQFV